MTMTTPAQLSLELMVTQKRIRDYLRSKYGTLPADETRWQLTEDEAEDVRARFSPEAARTSDLWPLKPGDVVRRRSIHERYGGQRQGGISTPRSRREVFVFTDPAKGARYGYDQFEGLREDGSYTYTGEGQRGPQQFKRGNRALRDAATDGKIIRLFRSSGKLATYVGSFTTGTPTYWKETIPDIDGNPREGLIFNLLPLDARVDLLPAYGGELSPDEGLINYAANPVMWTPPDCNDVVVEGTDRDIDERVVSRVEFELQAAFGAWLLSRDLSPKRLPLRAGSTTIEPDMYVPEHGWVVEAKRSAARSHVRTAIGQVLDYVHVAKRAGLTAIPVVVLPGAPQPELVELMSNLGITILARTADGFEELAPT